MKTKLLLSATLLMSGICFAQSNHITFTNTNQPKPEPQSLSFAFYITTEDGHPVGTCPPNSSGCAIYFINPFIAITLPDIPNQYSNHNTLTCTIESTKGTGIRGCTGLRCQSITYTATGDYDYGQDNDQDSTVAPCRDADGRVWTVVTTQYYHWQHVGKYMRQVYDGGKGTIRH
jgi:hypothetical protein